MNINSYSFGKISIDNEVYKSDLIIFPDSIQDNWWRKKGHLLQKEDLSTIIDYKPELLIVGTGKYGKMRVPQNLVDDLENMNISIKVYNTDNAVKIYKNRKSNDTVCALHLTC